MEADWVLGSREADMILPVGFAIFFPIARSILNKVLYEVSLCETCFIAQLIFGECTCDQHVLSCKGWHALIGLCGAVLRSLLDGDTCSETRRGSMRFLRMQTTR
jgi:hypothetical protein